MKISMCLSLSTISLPFQEGLPEGLLQDYSAHYSSKILSAGLDQWVIKHYTLHRCHE